MIAKSIQCFLGYLLCFLFLSLFLYLSLSISISLSLSLSLSLSFSLSLSLSLARCRLFHPPSAELFGSAAKQSASNQGQGSLEYLLPQSLHFDLFKNITISPGVVAGSLPCREAPEVANVQLVWQV